MGVSHWEGQFSLYIIGAGAAACQYSLRAARSSSEVAIEVPQGLSAVAWQKTATRGATRGTASNTIEGFHAQPGLARARFRVEFRCPSSWVLRFHQQCEIKLDAGFVQGALTQVPLERFQFI